MKLKNLSQIILIIAMALSGHFAFAGAVESQFELRDNRSGQPGTLNVAVAVNDVQAGEVIREKKAVLEISDSTVISSEYSEPQSKEFIEEALAGKPLMSHGEKLGSVTMITLQIAGTAGSYIFLSHLPVATKMVDIAVAALMTYYYRPEMKRWQTFQRWGRDKISGWADKMGLSDWRLRNGQWFGDAAKTATGLFGTLGTTSIFVGINLWDKFAQVMTTDVGQFAEKLGFAAGMNLFMSQPYDTLFDNWLENGRTKFTPAQIRLAMRLKSLFTTVLTPLIYTGNTTAIAVGTGMGLTGWTLLVFDKLSQKTSCEERLQSSAER